MAFWDNSCMGEDGFESVVEVWYELTEKLEDAWFALPVPVQIGIAAILSLIAAAIALATAYKLLSFAYDRTAKLRGYFIPADGSSPHPKRQAVILSVLIVVAVSPPLMFEDLSFYLWRDVVILVCLALGIFYFFFMRQPKEEHDG